MECSSAGGKNEQPGMRMFEEKGLGGPGERPKQREKRKSSSFKQGKGVLTMRARENRGS